MTHRKAVVEGLARWINAKECKATRPARTSRSFPRSCERKSDDTCSIDALPAAIFCDHSVHSNEVP